MLTFDEKCVRLIQAHRDRCRHYADWSVGNAALYNEELGFMGAAALAKRAEEEERRVDEVAEEEKSRTEKAGTGDRKEKQNKH